MIIALLLKESMISLRGTNVILYNKIAKIIDYDWSAVVAASNTNNKPHTRVGLRKIQSNS